MTCENVYRKTANGCYVPCGVSYGEYLSDGIWYVHNDKYSTENTQVDYIARLFRVSKTEPVDIPKLCGLHTLCEEIMKSKELNDILEDHHTVSDIVHVVVKKLVKKSEDLNK